MLAAAIVATARAAERGAPVVLNDDGGWCWFQDERALIVDGKLIVASVANGARDASRRGDIDVVTYDPATGQVERIELYDRLEADDHDAPSLWIRPDGRLLVLFAKHGSENKFYYRVSNSPGDAKSWGPLRTFSPSAKSRVTYANLLYLSSENHGRGRLYNFYRGLDASFKPSYAYSEDDGESWKSGNVAINVPTAFRHRPYVRYAGNGKDTIHWLYTEGHPRNFDNSVYHAFYRDGDLHRSDGGAIRPLSEGLAKPEEGTLVFQGDADHVAWVSDLHLSDDGRPYAVFSVQENAAGLPSGDKEAGQDHRYHYAWWDGSAWREHEIAYAGTRLYAGEDDYTGNLCLDPDRLDTVYISTNADPQSGRPLMSAADGLRHYEIFRGTTTDGGQSWTWQAITKNSTQDNLRPFGPNGTPSTPSCSGSAAATTPIGTTKRKSLV